MTIFVENNQPIWITGEFDVAEGLSFSRNTQFDFAPLDPDGGGARVKIPAGYVLADPTIYIKTAFNGTNMTIRLGIAASPSPNWSIFGGSSEIIHGTPGVYRSTNWKTAAQGEITSSVDLKAVIDWNVSTGSAPTAGRLIFQMPFMPSSLT